MTNTSESNTIPVLDSRRVSSSDEQTVLERIHADRPWSSALPVLLFALTFSTIFRVILAQYSLWFDELASVYFSSQPLSNLWSHWMLRESNPPLYYTVLKGWIAIVGRNPLELRLLTILFSLIAILIHYVGISRHYGRRAAVISAILLSVSGEQLHFSHLVRTYMLLYVAISISYYGLLSIMEDSDRLGYKSLPAWGAYVGGAILGVYLHTTACIWPIVATISLILVDGRFRPAKSSRWLEIASADLAIMLVSSWWLFITYLQILSPSGNLSWLEWHGLVDTASTFFSAIFLSFKASGWQAVTPIALAAAAVFGAYRQFGSRVIRFTSCCLGTSIVLFTSASLVQPVIVEATIFWISIFSLVLISVGLASIRSTKVFIATTLAVIILLGFNLIQVALHLERENWAAAVKLPYKDHHAVLLVNSEAVNVLANTACMVELNLDRCPFPIVTIRRSNLRSDAWANGLGTRVAMLPGGQLKMPKNPNFYLFRQMSYDVLATLHRVGLLNSVPLDQAKILGPFPARLFDELSVRVPLKDGIFTLSPTPTRH